MPSLAILPTKAEPAHPASRRIVSNMCTSEECGACAGGGARIANLPSAICHWKWTSNHCINEVSYSASDPVSWKCLLGRCPGVPLEWKTGVRSAGGRHERSNSLKAEVGAAGISVQYAIVAGRAPRASHKRR